MTNALAKVRLEPHGIASPIQKKFNRLIKKINKLEKVVFEWKQVIPQFEQIFQRDYMPLRQAYHNGYIALAKRLDEIIQSKKLTNRQHEAACSLITNLLAKVLSENQSDDLVALYDKYSELKYNEYIDLETDKLRESAKEYFGVDLDPDVDIRSPEDLLKTLFEKMSDQDEDELSSVKKISKREQKQQEESILSQNALRDIFRKLASALHPDKAQDEEERVRRHSLMQRVNQAYEKNDLLKLLSLQLEVEQIQADDINQMTDAQIKKYNRSLEQKAEELMLEIEALKIGFLTRYEDKMLFNYAEPEPHTIIQLLKYQMSEIEQYIKACQADLLEFQDIKKLKKWLNEEVYQL